MNKTLDLGAYIAERSKLVDAALEQYLPQQPTHGDVGEIMRYAVFPGGKRFRPVLTIATAEALGHAPDRVMAAACAFELVHAFSLVHDDLPCMDDDTVRRGKPTCHVKFGEAEALLAGDALLIEAFRLVTFSTRVSGVKAEAALRVSDELALASGMWGMVGGQMLDIQGMRMEEVAGDKVREIHRAKTGALIRGSVRAGAMLCDASVAQLDALTAYSERLGLVFQITDDLLDYQEKHEVVSYPAAFGPDESRRLAQVATDEALEYLRDFPSSAEPLRELARYLLRRDK